MQYPLQYSKFGKHGDIEFASNKKTFCVDCGIEISKGATRCVVCESKRRRRDSLILKHFPTEQDVISLVKKVLLSSYVAVGREYDVTDNSVRK